MPPARPQWRLIALKVALVLLATFVLFEGGLRLLMFSSWATGWHFVYPLRREMNYGYNLHDTEYWELQYELLPEHKRLPVPGYDPQLGWTGNICRPGDYMHIDAPRVGARRPVLLYGDSYSQCLTSVQDCFQGLLQRSPLGETHALMNYGVGGYGLDQTYLMYRSSIDAWAERDPVVLIGMLVDDDLDRCLLGFRCWPKPRLEVAGDQLQPTRPVPRIEDYFEERGPALTSYGLRFLRYGAQLWPRHTIFAFADEAQAELKQLVRQLLEELVVDLEGRGVDYAFVLFYSEIGTTMPERLGWRDELVRSTLDELGAPWVDTRRVLVEQAAAEGMNAREYFGDDRVLKGHLNPRGNEIAFRALLDAVEGYTGERQRPWVVSPAVHAGVVLRGEQAVARYEDGLWGPFQSPEDRPRLCFRVGEEGPVEMSYRLGGRVSTFRARARFVPLEQFAGDQGSVGLTLLGDGQPLYQGRLRRSDPELALEVELAGREELTIRVDDAADGIEGDLIVLRRPEFE